MVPHDEFWVRRLRDGDVVEAEAPAEPGHADPVTQPVVGTAYEFGHATPASPPVEHEEPRL